MIGRGRIEQQERRPKNQQPREGQLHLRDPEENASTLRRILMCKRCVGCAHNSEVFFYISSFRIRNPTSPSHYYQSLCNSDLHKVSLSLGAATRACAKCKKKTFSPASRERSAQMAKNWVLKAEKPRAATPRLCDDPPDPESSSSPTKKS